MERGRDANRIRVQTDNLDRPFDLNRGSKLDLGSTAKLRTLVTYLQVLAKLHGHYAHLPLPALDDAIRTRSDALGRWVISQLKSDPHLPLRDLLSAGMSRRYSASPHQSFFTGGGLHRFSNFDHDDDHRSPTVEDAFRRSVNLVFIRLMQDIVAYYQAELPRSTEQLLTQTGSSLRQSYLARFADQEGTVYLRRFYKRHAGLSTDQMFDALLQRSGRTASALAVVAASVTPNVPQAHVPEDCSLADRAYLADLHPLELWLVGYLRDKPHATLAEALYDSERVRQEA